MSPRLTRRDAIAALGAAGITIGAGVITLESLEDDIFSPDDVARLVAVADVIYPTELEGIDTFVERFLAGRATDRPTHAAAVRDAGRRVDEYAHAWEDTAFVDLDRQARGQLLRAIGLDTATPDPDGADPGQLRYYLVNELLYALYTTPTGAELVGLENPQGYPGGTASYRRPPPD